MKMNSTIVLLFSGALLALLGSCGGGSSSGSGGGGGSTVTTPNTYATTSTRGDYAEWTLDGSTLNATWQSISDIGEVDYTFTITANCSAANSFNLRNCTISTSSCADGVSACPADPTGDLELMDAPGVALFVNTDPGMVTEQLHIGFAKNNDGCGVDMAGDYSFIRTGLGLSDIFGMYRSDANAINITHADFGFDSADDNVTSQTVGYRTGTPVEMFDDDGCVNGVRTRGNGGSALRIMVTNSGLFILDLPSGQGGLVSFKTSTAASLSDFAGKTFTGISFPDNSAPEALRAVFGAAASRIPVDVSFTGSGSQSLRLMDIGTADSATLPTYPDFGVAPGTYGGSVLAATYPTPANIPGLFKFDQLGDSGRVIVAAMKSGGKIIGVGMVYNWRTTFDIDPSAGDGVTTFGADGLYNTGNFIIFEE